MNRNIILVTVDSLRADHCGFHGSSDLTPTLDEMAAEGVVYEDAIAPGPRTPSSMPVTFTGEHIGPIDGEESDDGEEDYWERWRENIRQHMERYRTVAQDLQAAGYATIGVTVNPWTQGTGFDAGFDVFENVNGDALGEYGPPLFRIADKALRQNSLGEKVKWFNKREWFIRWTDFYDEIVEAIQIAREPYFVWLFLLDSHQPYVAPRAYRTESSTVGMYYATMRELLSSNGSIPTSVETGLGKAYRDSIRSIDGFVGRLQEECRNDDPIIVFHSDHGEGFGEHGTYGHEPELYRENLQVPFVVCNGPEAERVAEPISLRRLPGVLRSLAGGGEFDPHAFTSEFVVSTTENEGELSVTGSAWKYIRKDGDEQLYNRAEDPEEERNLAASHPTVTQSMAVLAANHLRHRNEKQLIEKTAAEGCLNYL